MKQNLITNALPLLSDQKIKIIFLFSSEYSVNPWPYDPLFRGSGYLCQIRQSLIPIQSNTCSSQIPWNHKQLIVISQFRKISKVSDSYLILIVSQFILWSYIPWSPSFYVNPLE